MSMRAEGAPLQGGGRGRGRGAWSRPIVVASRSDKIAGMWCWSCGAEYREGYVRCPDCAADLVHSRPPKQEHATDHDQLEYDLAGWSSEQRRAAVLWLER